MAENPSTRTTLLTFQKIALRLSVSTRALRKWVASGRFGPRVLHLGRSLRVNEAELAQWIEQGCPSRDKFDARKAL